MKLSQRLLSAISAFVSPVSIVSMLIKFLESTLKSFTKSLRAIFKVFPSVIIIFSSFISTIVQYTSRFLLVTLIHFVSCCISKKLVRFGSSKSSFRTSNSDADRYICQFFSLT